jgi:hypothetical protein
MVDTNDHNIAAFDVRDNPAKLAEAVANYPKLDKSKAKPKEPKAGKKDNKKPSDEERRERRRRKREAEKNSAG